MKRSEMKQYIVDALYCHYPYDNKQLNVIAECVLQTIEGGNSSGKAMLPPTTKLSHIDAYDNAWDPEDQQASQDDTNIS